MKKEHKKKKLPDIVYLAIAKLSILCHFRSLPVSVTLWIFVGRPTRKHRASNGHVLSGVLVGDDPLRRVRQPEAMPTGGCVQGVKGCEKVDRVSCACDTEGV